MEKSENFVYIKDTDLKGRDYLKKICEFKEINDMTYEDLDKYKPICYKNYEKEKHEKHVWALFGSVEENGTNDKQWVCIEVGSSKNINLEIKENLNSMKSKPSEIEKKTAFHENVYKFRTYMDKHSVKYRTIYDRWKEFIIYEIDIDEYLKTLRVQCNKYSPINYTEVKFAFETKAIFWNPAPMTNKNQERKILLELKEDESKRKYDNTNM